MLTEPFKEKELRPEPRRTEKELLMFQIQTILIQYGNLEAGIPFGHVYWALTNQYRGLK